ncbi:MAG: two-component regulator propeller domain-containing protein [Verrucomicrobiota bacterium]
MVLSFSAGALGIPQYHSRAWQIEDGLPDNTVQAITQTRDGYLWVGTTKGLARFDGVRFTIFNCKSGMPGENITSLCERRDGTLWMSSIDGGVMQLKDGKFFSGEKRDGLASNNVKVIYETKEGVLWAGSTAGLDRFENGRFVSVNPKIPWKYGVVRALAEDEQGQLWAGTERGLVRAQKEKAILALDQNHNANHPIKTIWPMKEGNLWVGTAKLGLIRYQDGGSYLFTARRGLLDEMVTVVFGDSKKNLWVGSYAGLCRLVDGKFLPELNHEKMAFNMVNAIFEDREGHLWIGSKDGLGELTPRPFTTYTEEDGLTRNNVVAVTESVEDGLWIGSWGGGVTQFKDEKFVSIAPRSLEQQRLYNPVLSLHCDSDGGLWIGSDFSGDLFHYQNKEFVSYTKEGSANRALRVIYRDRKNQLWIGSTAGLLLFENDEFKRFTTRDGLAGNDVRAMVEDRQGNFWIGTDHGLSLRRNGESTHFTSVEGLATKAVTAFYADTETNLWIGTGGGGLCKIKAGFAEETLKEKMPCYTTRDGLFSDEIYAILEDDYGYFWMASPVGIFRIAKKSFEDFSAGKITKIPSRSFGRAEGMVSIQCNGVGQPSACKTKNGQLWFATAKGVATVDPQSVLVPATPPPPILIEEVLADKKVQRSTAGIARSAVLNIPPGRGELEFHYTALSFYLPEKVRFKYQLKGFDDDWIDAGSRRTANYSKLPPGEYRFFVVGCDSHGTWNQAGASVALRLQPHFWQTGWFVGVGALAMLGVVGGTVRYATKRRLQDRMEKLEQQHALDKERERIAQDMHDDLGARLTEILFLNERAQNSEKNEHRAEAQGAITEVAGGIAQNLDAIVWAVSPRNDTLERTALYLWDYAEKFLAKTPIRCRSEMPADWPVFPVSSETRHNLFLIVKEALNNLVKYSGASEVWFRLQLRESKLILSIEDNGKGFAANTLSEFGNGLENMRIRTEKMGGSFDLQSELGKGTRLQIKIPLRHAARSQDLV